MGFYIYKLKDCNYIGCTSNIKERIVRHKLNRNNSNMKNYHLKVYKFLRENNIEVELIIIEYYDKDCSRKIKNLVEQFYINLFDSINNGTNTYNAFQSKRQRREYIRKHQQKNKERINELKRIKVKCNICNCFINRNNLQRHKKSIKCKSCI